MKDHSFIGAKNFIANFLRRVRCTSFPVVVASSIGRIELRAALLLFATLAGVISHSFNTHAQSKFFSTPSRGGAEGARAQAQLTAIQNESMRTNACTVIGRIYAPTHPNRDTNDCIPHFTLNPTTGAATFTNGVTVNSGGAAVTGDSTFNNNLTVGGRVTANQLFVGSGNIGSVPTCSSAQQLQWTGSAWSCVSTTVASPSGMVAAFSLATCPGGWSPLELARGRFIVGAGSLGADSYGLGATGGSARHTLTVAEMPSHSHLETNSNIGTLTLASDDVFGHPHNGTTMEYVSNHNSWTSATGGGQPHENRPPYLALLYCIKS